MKGSVAAPLVRNGTLIDTNRESHNTRLQNCVCTRMLRDPRTPPLHSATPQDKLLVLASNSNSYNKCLAHFFFPATFFVTKAKADLGTQLLLRAPGLLFGLGAELTEGLGFGGGRGGARRSSPHTP